MLYRNAPGVRVIDCTINVGDHARLLVTDATADKCKALVVQAPTLPLARALALRVSTMCGSIPVIKDCFVESRSRVRGIHNTVIYTTAADALPSMGAAHGTYTVVHTQEW